jgi:hypothetical protein
MGLPLDLPSLHAPSGLHVSSRPDTLVDAVGVPRCVDASTSLLVY